MNSYIFNGIVYYFIYKYNIEYRIGYTIKWVYPILYSILYLYILYIYSYYTIYIILILYILYIYIYLIQRKRDPGGAPPNIERWKIVKNFTLKKQKYGISNSTRSSSTMKKESRWSLPWHEFYLFLTQILNDVIINQVVFSTIFHQKRANLKKQGRYPRFGISVH